MASILRHGQTMQHLPRSTVALCLVLLGLIGTLLGFAMARRSSEAEVHTHLAHQLVADFQNQFGFGADAGVSLAAPRIVEWLLLLGIALVSIALWRNWPRASQHRSAKPRS
jgi:hypothetical protein